MAEDGVVSRYHSMVQEPSKDKAFVVPTASMTESIKYLHPAATRALPKAVSLVAVGDWSTVTGLTQLQYALTFLKMQAEAGDAEASPVRLGFVLSMHPSKGGTFKELIAGKPFGKWPASIQAAYISQVLVGLVADRQADGAADIATDLAALEFLQSVVDLLMPVIEKGDEKGAKCPKFEALAKAGKAAGYEGAKDVVLLLQAPATEAAYVSSIASLEQSLNKELSATAPRSSYDVTVTANGRCVLSTPENPLSPDDYALLMGLELKARGHKVMAVMQEMQLEGKGAVAAADHISNSVAVSAAFLGEYMKQPREDLAHHLAVSYNFF